MSVLTNKRSADIFCVLELFLAIFDHVLCLLEKELVYYDGDH